MATVRYLVYTGQLKKSAACAVRSSVSGTKCTSSSSRQPLSLLKHSLSNIQQSRPFQCNVFQLYNNANKNPQKRRESTFKCASAALDNPQERPLPRFGVISDVQYADKPDKINSRGVTVGYRSALGKLEEAVCELNSLSPPLDFVLHLGDIIDGNTTAEKTLEDFHKVNRAFQRLKVPVVHVMGNHCQAAPRELLLNELFPQCQQHQAYHSLKLGGGWHLVVLDTTELGTPSAQSPLPDESAAFLEAHPPSTLSNTHVQPWNGGVGKKQMSWLKTILEDIRRIGERAIVAMHHPVQISSSSSKHLAWNHEDLSHVLISSSVVQIVLNGHYHPGGYSVHENTHYLGLEGVVETPEKSNAYAIISLSSSQMDMVGHGQTCNRMFPLLK